MVAAASRWARSIDWSPIETVTSGSAAKRAAWLSTPAQIVPSPPAKAHMKPSPTPTTMGGSAKGIAASPASQAAAGWARRQTP